MDCVITSYYSRPLMPPQVTVTTGFILPSSHQSHHIARSLIHSIIHSPSQSPKPSTRPATHPSQPLIPSTPSLYSLVSYTPNPKPAQSCTHSLTRPATHTTHTPSKTDVFSRLLSCSYTWAAFVHRFTVNMPTPYSYPFLNQNIQFIIPTKRTVSNTQDY